MYFWKELHKDELVPNDATYESLDFLLSKIHQLENRCRLVNLPYYNRDDTAPPKKWIREVCKARSAARNSQAVEGHVGVVETWLRTNPEAVVANAFKTATAVARGIPQLSSAKASADNSVVPLASTSFSVNSRALIERADPPLEGRSVHHTSVFSDQCPLGVDNKLLHSC